MKAAVDVLAELGGTKQTIAVLGDMLELGPQSSAFHQDVGKHVAARHITSLVNCGKLGRQIAEGRTQGRDGAHRVFEYPSAAAGHRWRGIDGC